MDKQKAIELTRYALASHGAIVELLEEGLYIYDSAHKLTMMILFTEDKPE